MSLLTVGRNKEGRMNNISIKCGFICHIIHFLISIYVVIWDTNIKAFKNRGNNAELLL